MKYTFTLCVSIVIFIALGCNAEIGIREPFAGTFQVNNLLIIGDELASGYSNNGLYEEAQLNSFSNLLVNQLAQIAPFEFEQSIIEGNGSGYWILDSIDQGICPNISPIPQISLKDSSSTWRQNVANNGPFDNLALPGLLINDLDNLSKLNSNPYFNRIQLNSEQTYLDLINSREPDLFIIWIGMNDILSFAKNGGVGTNYTSPEIFSQKLEFLIEKLSSFSPKPRGVIGNIPDFTLYPYFSNLKSTYINPDDCSSFPIYIQTASGVRIASTSDKILMSANGLLGKDTPNGKIGLSQDLPLSDSLVLDDLEVFNVQNLINEYNDHIRNLTHEYNLELSKIRLLTLDMYDTMDQICNYGIQVDGLSLSGEYLTGGVFSLDGLYFTPRANAFITNKFIGSVNRLFDATIPTLNITDFKAVEFP